QRNSREDNSRKSKSNSESFRSKDNSNKKFGAKSDSYGKSSFSKDRKDDNKSFGKSPFSKFSKTTKNHSVVRHLENQMIEMTTNHTVDHLIKKAEAIENLTTENLMANPSRRKDILKTEDPSQLPNTKSNAKRTISSILRIENLDLLTSLRIKKQKMTA
ncbi:MAG TPA: hypothetical protein VK023_03265, partial [Sphingobacterium bovisgrunnientis]|nr:hypothetical protein [Sphingobacterium bovisgrunnientis]